MDINKYRQRLERLKGQAEQLQSGIVQSQTQIKKLGRDQRNAEQAQVIIQTVAKQTQDELTFYVSDLVTSALEAVFEKEAYQFDCEFVQKRNKTECELSFVRDGARMNPMTDSGGGAIDIAALALRVCLWSIQRPRSRNTLVLDEPFKHLKGIGPNRLAIQMIKQLSEKLRLQIIMVSDERVPMVEIEKGADRIFEVSIKNRVSKVEVIK